MVYVEEILPKEAAHFFSYFKILRDLHIMCIKEKLPSDFKEAFTNFRNKKWA